jgi:drug/metabolite transporter (DMT)-like permease
MEPGHVVLATAFLSFVFAYLAVNMEDEQHGAILKFAHIVLAYIMVSVTGYLALQVANYTILGSSVLSSLMNAYSLLFMFLIGWLAWHFYWNLVADQGDD